MAAYASTNAQNADSKPKNVVAICPLAILPGIPKTGFNSKLKIKYEHAASKNISVGTFLAYAIYPHKNNDNQKYFQGIDYSLFGRYYFIESLNGFYGQLKVQGFTNVSSEKVYQEHYGVAYRGSAIKGIDYYSVGFGGGYQLIKGQFSLDFGVGLKVTSFPFDLNGSRFGAALIPAFWYSLGSGSIIDSQISVGYRF